MRIRTIQGQITLMWNTGKCEFASLVLRRIQYVHILPSVWHTNPKSAFSCRVMICFTKPQLVKLIMDDIIYLFYRIFKWYSLWWCPPPPTDLQEILLNMDCWLKCPFTSFDPIHWFDPILLPLIVSQTLDTSTSLLTQLKFHNKLFGLPYLYP